MPRLVLLLLLLPTTALAQQVASPAAPSGEPVHITSRDGTLLSARLVVGWHTESYRVRYENRYGATTGYGVGYTHVADTVPLCTTPCIAELPSGPVRLTVHDGRGAMFTETFVAPAGAELRLHVDRHGEIRGLGWMLFATSTLGWIGGGTTILGAVLDIASDGNGFLPHDHWVAGIGASAASLALWLFVALPLVSVGDGAHVEVIPGGIRF